MSLATAIEMSQPTFWLPLDAIPLAAGAGPDVSFTNNDLTSLRALGVADLNGVDFNSNTDYISFNTSTNGVPTNLPYTVEYVVNRDNEADFMVLDYLARAVSGSNNGFGGTDETHTGFYNTGVFYAAHENSGVRAEVITTAVATAGTPFHVVNVFDHDGSDTTITVYVNAEVEGTDTATNSATLDGVTCLLGRPEDDTNRTFNGILSHFARYDRAMGADEVVEHYRQMLRWGVVVG